MKSFGMFGRLKNNNQIFIVQIENQEGNWLAQMDLENSRCIFVCVCVFSFLQLIIPTLPHVKLSSTDSERGSLFWAHEADAVETLVLDFMLDVLLLPYK